MPFDHDATLGELTFVAFDTETTGLSPTRDRIVELAAVHFDLTGHEYGRLQMLVNPGVPIPEKVSAIHGITDGMVARAPSVGAAVIALSAFLSHRGAAAQRTVLVGHNVDFDLAFVRAALASAGGGGPLRTALALDSRALCREHDIGRIAPETGKWRDSLTTVLDVLGVTLTGAHRALADSLGVQAVVLQLLNRYIVDRERLRDVPGARLRGLNGVTVTAEPAPAPAPALEGGHPCAAPNCPTSVRLDLLMCPKHWQQLPPSLQQGVWAFYVRGRALSLSQGRRDYQEAVRLAVAALS